MEKNPKSESYIVKEAENIIENYLKNREEDYHNSYYKEKYERLRILTVALGVVGSIGILVSIIF